MALFQQSHFHLSFFVPISALKRKCELTDFGNIGLYIMLFFPIIIKHKVSSINYLFNKYLLNVYYVTGTILGTGNIKSNKAIDLSSCSGDQQLNRQFQHSMLSVSVEKIWGTGRVWGRLSEGTDNQAETDLKSKLVLLGKRWWG